LLATLSQRFSGTGLEVAEQLWAFEENPAMLNYFPNTNFSPGVKSV
jgi:hypothetical protein